VPADLGPEGPGTDMRIQPLEPGSLSARTYVTLREALVGGNFRPGQRLLMQELADQLGTSITPVREACLRLVSERALELRSGRFVTIPDLTLARYMEIRTIRANLEGFAAELAAERVDAAGVKTLETLQAQFEVADRAGDAKTAMRLNRDFHFTVYRLPGLEMLTGLIESLWLSMGPILNVFYTKTVNDYVGAEEHLGLIEALRRHDKKQARAAIERDILRGGESLIRYLNEREAAGEPTDGTEPVRAQPRESAAPPSRRRRQ
jgi:GntR family transcriptional regulator, colanic acid and biofilm gene transcriptional regulator